MAKSQTKADRIVVRLESEMRAKLHERASALGLDDAAYVRMLIYSDLRGEHISRETLEVTGEFRRHPPRQAAPGIDHGEEPPEPPPVEEIDIPPDPDGEPSLDALMGAGPSLLDDIAALTATPHHQATPRQAPAYAKPSSYRRQPFNNRDWGRAAWSGPGSLTRAVGIGGELVGNVQGDGRGNVTRDNFAHFGAVGTRSR